MESFAKNAGIVHVPRSSDSYAASDKENAGNGEANSVQAPSRKVGLSDLLGLGSCDDLGVDQGQKERIWDSTSCSVLAMLEEDRNEERGAERFAQLGSLQSVPAPRQALPVIATDVSLMRKRANSNTVPAGHLPLLLHPSQQNTSRLYIDMQKIQICVDGVEASCWQPFREYSISLTLRGSTPLCRQHQTSMRYRIARSLLLDRFKADASFHGMMKPLENLFEQFPAKHRGMTTSPELAKKRASGLRDFIHKALVKLDELYKDHKFHKAAGELQYNFLKFGLGLDQEEIAESLSRLAHVLGMH